MAASKIQRERAADALRAGETQAVAAKAARVDESTIRRWLREDDFRALVLSSPDIRSGPPPRMGGSPATPESQRDVRSRLWVTADGSATLGHYIPPSALEDKGSVLHVHPVQPGDVQVVAAAIEAQAWPEESPYLAVPLSGLDGLLDNLELACRLASPDQKESLGTWLELWKLIDEEGRSRALAESIWPGQQRFLSACLEHRHVFSIKARKTGLSTLCVAYAAYAARVRDVNANVACVSYREDAAAELLRALKRGFDSLPPWLRLPLERESSSVLAYAAGSGDTRVLRAFPATERTAIESTVSHLLLDEWAHQLNPEAVWAALEPTLPTRASSAIVTTAKSPGDAVHEYWSRSVEGNTRHHAIFVSALERPDRTPEWLQEKRRQLGKWKALRNYATTPEEAFSGSGEPLFSPELLVAAQRDAMPPSLDYGPQDRFVTAWDLGRRDASVGTVLRCPAPGDVEQIWDVVAYVRLVEQPWPRIQDEVAELHRAFPGPTVVEANGIGDPVIACVLGRRKATAAL